jgi:hypothetical protein
MTNVCLKECGLHNQILLCLSINQLRTEKHYLNLVKHFSSFYLLSFLIEIMNKHRSDLSDLCWTTNGTPWSFISPCLASALDQGLGVRLTDFFNCYFFKPHILKLLNQTNTIPYSIWHIQKGWNSPSCRYEIIRTLKTSYANFFMRFYISSGIS